MDLDERYATLATQLYPGQSTPSIRDPVGYPRIVDLGRRIGVGDRR